MDDVIPCRPITDHSIKGLARRCPKLTILSLAYLRRVTHETLEAVVEDLPLLRQLDVRGVAGKPLPLEGIRELIDSGPALRTLQISVRGAHTVPPTPIFSRALRGWL